MQRWRVSILDTQTLKILTGDLDHCLRPVGKNYYRLNFTSIGGLGIIIENPDLT